MKIFLPVYDNAIEEGNFESDDGKKRDKTVLIIEDNPFNLHLAEAIFENMGFQVLKAENGGQAIDIAENYGEAIGLSLLDMMLPDMGGEDVYPRITAARPDMKVIICSGYSSQEAWKKIHEIGSIDFIQKPIDSKKLKSTLKRMEKAHRLKRVINR